MVDYAAHIKRLAQTHQITIDWRVRTRGRAWTQARLVRLQRVTTAKTYAIALHELGHVLGAQPKHRIDRELAAWEWARMNALEWTPAMFSVAHESLLSYKTQAVRRAKFMVFDASTFTPRLQALRCEA